MKVIKFIVCLAVIAGFVGIASNASAQEMRLRGCMPLEVVQGCQPGTICDPTPLPMPFRCDDYDDCYQLFSHCDPQTGLCEFWKERVGSCYDDGVIEHCCIEPLQQLTPE